MFCLIFFLFFCSVYLQIYKTMKWHGQVSLQLRSRSLSLSFFSLIYQIWKSAQPVDEPKNHFKIYIPNKTIHLPMFVIPFSLHLCMCLSLHLWFCRSFWFIHNLHSIPFQAINSIDSFYLLMFNQIAKYSIQSLCLANCVLRRLLPLILLWPFAYLIGFLILPSQPKDCGDSDGNCNGGGIGIAAALNACWCIIFKTFLSLLFTLLEIINVSFHWHFLDTVNFKWWCRKIDCKNNRKMEPCAWWRTNILR